MLIEGQPESQPFEQRIEAPAYKKAVRFLTLF
jgi:hypothetical protein